MTREEFNRLIPGDIVREKKTGLGYVVTGTVKDRGGLILVRVVHHNLPEELEFVDRERYWERVPIFEKRRKPKRKIEVED